VSLLLTATTARGFVTYVNSGGQVLKWNLVTPRNDVPANVVNRNTKAIRYFIASDAFSAVNRTAELNAVRAAFGQWQSVPGTILKFEEGGLLAGPGIDINTADSTNVIFWAKNSTLVNGGMDDISGLQAHTVVAFANDNTILESDIVLNGVQSAWFTDLSQVNRRDSFVESMVLHEIGHFIGLDHSPVGAATVTANLVGIGADLGLSSDEVAAARALYPQSSIPSTLGNLRGTVLMNAGPVYGAMITAEDINGNIATGTISRRNGTYELPALPPGSYFVRASPLDPITAADGASLMRGPDIVFADYDDAVTSFLPTTNKTVRVVAGGTASLDFNVTAGNPPFRVTAISHPSDSSDLDTHLRGAASIVPGSTVFVGVSLNVPITGNAILTVTGDGVSAGPTFLEPGRFGDQPLLSILLKVANNATPGLRSFVVQQGPNLAYANGYLEVLPPFQDFNFDGFDDAFQRRFFSVFTAGEAAPAADPDGDGYDNRSEYLAGSDPTNRLSFNFRIESVRVAADGSTVTWQSVPGKRYQLFNRRDFSNSAWQAIGLPVAARGTTTQFIDSSARDATRFYRIQALP
jgi:hypothetical protein